MNMTAFPVCLFAVVSTFISLSCQDDTDLESVDAHFADTVVSAPSANDGPYGNPAFAVDGVRGEGESAANAGDVFSLGNKHPLVLTWSERSVCNGTGVDFVVFENPFRIGNSNEYFMEPAVIYLSNDGENWVPFPFDYTAPDERVFSRNPWHWQGFAGIRPVLFNIDTNPVDPFGIVAGGDPFDLDQLPDDGGASSDIRNNGFRYLRIVSSAAVDNPDTGAAFPKDDISNGPDIDGVAAQWLAPAGRCDEM